MEEVKKNIYIAEDGKEFSYERECKEYECRNARQKLETNNNVIVVDQINVSYLKDTKWYYVKNIEGAKEIIKAFPHIIYYNTSKKVNYLNNWINKMICIRYYNDPCEKAVLYDLNDWITMTNNRIDSYTTILEDLIKAKEAYKNINNSINNKVKAVETINNGNI